MFEGQTWWVTGASSGIGEAVAAALAERGAKLVLSGRNVEALERVAARCGETLILPFEAAEFDRISALAAQAWDWSGRIDGLINNAGISQRSLAVDTSFDVYRRMIDVDLLGPIALTQALLPRMAEAGGGRIVAISSVAGMAGVPLRTAYCAAKHGLIGYHDAVRAETAHLGIHVHVVCPGSIRTDVSRNALNADGSTRGVSDAVIDAGMEPAEAARRILAGIEADEREIVIAEGAEADLAAMARPNAPAIFDRMAAMMQAGYARQMAAEAQAGEG